MYIPGAQHLDVFASAPRNTSVTGPLIQTIGYRKAFFYIHCSAGGVGASWFFRPYAYDETSGTRFPIGTEVNALNIYNGAGWLVFIGDTSQRNGLNNPAPPAPLSWEPNFDGGSYQWPVNTLGHGLSRIIPIILPKWLQIDMILNAAGGMNPTWSMGVDLIP